MSAIPRYAGQDRKELQKLLRDRGFRSTEGRLSLLSFLKRSSKPLPVEALARRLYAQLDEVNVYRALEAFAKAGLVSRVDLRHGHAHYEFTRGDHHHLVCVACDRIENFEGCGYEKLAQKALRQAKHFKRIEGHAIELFGLCKACAA